MNKADIFNTVDIKTKKVKVPEWGGDVYIRSMTGKDRSEWENSLFDENGKQHTTHTRERLIVFTAVDKDGNRIFNSEDIEALSGKSSIVIRRLSDVASDLNLLSDRRVEATKKN